MNGSSADWSAWTEKANHDFQTIALVMAAEEPPWDSIAFHAQQAAEKYLKAYLVFRGRQPPRVHDLLKLVELCAAFDPRFSDLADDADFLSPLAVLARYPGDPADPSRADAERGVRIAERIRDVVRAHLPIVGQPGQ
jgi:HEPN domain-containing protein